MDKEKGKKLLLEFTEILDYFGIPHFLIQGTALGAYRDNGFTPTEKDIDIGYLIEDLGEGLIKRLCRRLMRQKYQIKTFSRPFTKIRMMNATKSGCRIDLTGFMKWEDKRFASRIDDERKLIEVSIVHHHSMLEEYRKIELFGKEFNIPEQIETYLELTYGDWKVPSEDHALMESSVCIRKFIKNNNIPLDLLEKL